MTAVPLPLPEPPRRLLVPAWTLVVALIAMLMFSTAMFAFGRAARPPVTAGDDPAAPLAALVRVDAAILTDVVLAKQLLGQVTLPPGHASEAAMASRRKAIETIEAAVAMKAALNTPEAVAKRLASRLHRLDQAGLTWTPVPAGAPLESSMLGGESFIPLARITHPIDTKRVYVLHPTRGLLLSSDGGETWRAGLSPLATLTGTALAFTTDPAPLLLVIGPEIWAFTDDDPAFFPN